METAGVQSYFSPNVDMIAVTACQIDELAKNDSKSNLDFSFARAFRSLMIVPIHFCSRVANSFSKTLTSVAPICLL